MGGWRERRGGGGEGGGRRDVCVVGGGGEPSETLRVDMPDPAGQRTLANNSLPSSTGYSSHAQSKSSRDVSDRGTVSPQR